MDLTYPSSRIATRNYGNVNRNILLLLKPRHLASFFWKSRKRRLLTGCICLMLLLYSVQQSPERPVFDGPCPEIVWDENNNEDTITCQNLFQGKEKEVTLAKQFEGCSLQGLRSDIEYEDVIKDCDNFKTSSGYTSHAVTEEEINFPIAFSILMYENVQQMELMLQAIYRPHNVYCIHVDASASQATHDAVKSLTRCLHNVFLASRVTKVVYGMFPVLEAEMNCVKDLWNQTSSKWKYLINLTGREFPLRTNLELVQILKAYDGANDVGGSKTKRPRSWTAVKWWAHHLPSFEVKDSPPHGFEITKGSTHSVFSREFVGYMVTNQKAKDLLEWMRDVRVPDEQYFNTLNHNPNLGIPGSFKGDPDSKSTLTRYKMWQQFGDPCNGKWFHGICNFGVGDLPALSRSPALFANKFRIEFDAVTFYCMIQRNNKRTQNKYNSDFDISFYKKQPWVENHVKPVL